MYSFFIDGEDIKIFMNKLLKENSFSGFDLRSCEIKKDIFISFDGRLNKSFFDEEIEEDYCNWENAKHYIYDSIKGKKQPESIKLILSLNKNALEKIHKNAKACFLNIVFEEGKVAVATGTAQREFSLDKSLDDAWEDSVKRFFNKMNIVQNVEN